MLNDINETIFFNAKIAWLSVLIKDCKWLSDSTIDMLLDGLF